MQTYIHVIWYILSMIQHVLCTFSLVATLPRCIKDFPTDSLNPNRNLAIFPSALYKQQKILKKDFRVSLTFYVLLMILAVYYGAALTMPDWTKKTRRRQPHNNTACSTIDLVRIVLLWCIFLAFCQLGRSDCYVWSLLGCSSVNYHVRLHFPIINNLLSPLNHVTHRLGEGLMYTITGLQGKN